MSTSILNIASYKFVTLASETLPELRAACKTQGTALKLRGTILLSPEGINLNLAGTEDNIQQFQDWLAQNPAFADLRYKNSYSEDYTFQRFLVKIKKEIIAFGRAEINPVAYTAPYISPTQLKQWLREDRDIVLLDTRNDYEIAHGTFKNALDLNIQHFRDFPQAVQEKLTPEFKNKTIVTFCTGGIRCEKAALWMQQAGFQHIYQLEGGILDYFEQCKSEYYQGKCFVFDERVDLSPQDLF